MASREEVAEVILGIKLALSSESGLVMVERTKNVNALAGLGILPREIPGILRRLAVNDYSEGPLDDDKGREEKWWVFGPEFNGVPLYVKVSLVGGKVKRLSFHPADPELPRPLRNGGVGKR